MRETKPVMAWAVVYESARLGVAISGQLNVFLRRKAAEERLHCQLGKPRIIRVEIRELRAVRKKKVKR